MCIFLEVVWMELVNKRGRQMINKVYSILVYK